MRHTKLWQVIFIGMVLFVSGFVSAYNGTVEKEVKNEFFLESGLVGYWHFDEGDGNTVHDGSGFNNDGSIIGASWTTGISGIALEFDGNDGVWIDDDPVLDGFSSLTISVWAKPYNYKDGNMGYVVGKYQAHQSINCPYRIWAYEGDWIAELGDGSNCPIVRTPIIMDELWYHLVLWWDGAELKLYVNGNEEDSTPADITLYDNNEYLRFGERVNDGYFNGIIDEVRIYERALNNNEIKELFNNQAIYKWSFLFGRIDNLNANLGKIITFDAVKLRIVQLFPFQFLQFTSGEQIIVSKDKIGFINLNYVFGLFQVAL